jgi:HEAT repeat protein
MDANASRNPLISPDTALLFSIIHELTIARRNVSSYPKGHPVVTGSCEKVAGLFNRLFESRDELTVGIARDSLFVDGRSFERLTPVVRAFAKSLLYHQVAVITFAKGLTAEEIAKFNIILTAKRENISASGGIETVVRDAGLPNLRIREIRYDDLHVSEDTVSADGNGEHCPVSLWESFVLEMLRADTPFFPISTVSDTVVGPEALLGIIQGQPHEDQLQGMERLALFLRRESRRANLLQQEKEAFAQIVDFIRTLPSELRRHFFDCVLDALEGDEAPVFDIVSHLPGELVLEAVQRCKVDGKTLPPLLLRVVEKLSAQSPTDQGSQPGTDGEDGEHSGGIQGTLETIFRETTGEEYIPADYLAKLTALISSRDIPVPGEGELAELKQTLSHECIEVAVSDIILDSFLFASEEQMEALKRNLLDYCRYFLETGDFRSLKKMYERLRESRFESVEAATSLKQDMLETFAEAGFTEEVLNGLTVWGREKYDEISSLIHSVGKPFVEPLLDRLAEEENRTVRRYCLEQLIRLAESAGESVLARLDDSRWYVVRNLLIILRQSGNPDLAVHLRRVAGHPHPKVRHMVIETYLHLRDPEGDRLLLDDLASADRVARSNAIQLAEKSVHPDIVTALLHILQQKGTSPDSAVEKKAVIRSLAAIGDPRALVVLDKILNKRSLFRSSFYLSLKREIVQTLVKYRDPSALKLLGKMAESRNRELSEQASEQLRSVRKDRG